MEHQEKILIIDDSPVQANMLRSILEDDYEITVAHTAGMGLHHAKVGDFSLILLDVIMPEMDGFELLKELQEEVVTRHIPVILITSLSDMEHEERGLVLGAVDYITKPYHPPIVPGEYPCQALPLPVPGRAPVHDRPHDRRTKPAQLRSELPQQVAGGYSIPPAHLPVHV